MTDKTMTLEPCKECGSNETSWSCAPRNNGQAVDGRVCMREVSMQFYRGCDSCGETLEIIGADEFLAKLNSHLSQPAEPAPIPMILYCPSCGMQHIDAPETHHLDLALDRSGLDGSYSASWNNPPHRSHLCHGCGTVWRPADVPTVGVATIKTCGKADKIAPAERGEAVPVDERCPHGVRHPHPCRECEDGAPIRDDLYRAALNASGCIFRWRTSGIQPSYREFMAAEEALDKAIHARLTAQPPAAGVPDEQVASFVEKAGEIIGGKHFPSGQSLTKAREICDLAMAMLSATPSPTIDVEALHGFHGFEIVENASVPEGEVWVYDKTKLRAIGDAK